MNFNIDERATISSILDALKVEGISTEHVAKAIKGIGKRRLRDALKEAGYVFQNKVPKGWHYVGEGDEPLDKSIFDYVKQGNTKVKRSSPKVIQSNTPVKSSNTEVTTISPIVHPQFTRDEVEDLVAMLQEWRMNKAVEQLEVQEPKGLHERLVQLPPSGSTRKTVVMNNEIGKRFDEYCKKVKVNKSDIFSLAIMEFLDRNE